MKTKINYLTLLALALFILPTISLADNSLPNQILWNKDQAEKTVLASEDRFGYSPEDTEDHLRWA